MKDDYRNASFIPSGSFEQDFPIPELIGPTEILSEDHRWVNFTSNRDGASKISFPPPTERNFAVICQHEPKATPGH